MCTLVDDYIQISYRVGQKNKPPRGGALDVVPIGVFTLCGAGSRALEMSYSLEVLEGNAFFENESRRVAGRLFAAHGGYKATWDPNHGLNVSGMECCAEGRVHHLNLVESGHQADLRMSVRLEAEWRPVRSPFAQVGEFDEVLLTGRIHSTFPAVFPGTVQEAS